MLRDADAGIGHLELHHFSIREVSRRDRHRALLGELDGIIDEILEDMPKFSSIHANDGKFRRDLPNELDVVRQGVLVKCSDLTEKLPKIDFLQLDMEHL